MLANLSAESLHDVLQHVQATPSQRSLLHCILCCKTWRDVGLPLLLEHISIRNASFGPSAKGLTKGNARAVRSLTLKLTPEEEVIDYRNLTEASI